MAKYIKTEEGYKLKVGDNTTGKEYTLDNNDVVVAGYGAEIFNNYSLNTASGEYSHAEGDNTTASGNDSHAEGYATTASGASSHAEGNNTVASGFSSHVEGKGNTASGFYSHAEGVGTIASGLSSHAEGLNTIATHAGQHVQGDYNILDDSANSINEKGTYAHIVGNGTSNTNRSNAHTLDWNGVGWYQGGLQVGGNAQDDGAKNVLLEGDAVPMPNIAEVGQFLVVKAVDENGKPTEWEWVDLNLDTPEVPDSGQNVDFSVLTLGYHTDGLVYIFANGVPVGNGIKISGGTGTTDVITVADGVMTISALAKEPTQNEGVLNIK